MDQQPYSVQDFIYSDDLHLPCCPVFSSIKHGVHCGPPDFPIFVQLEQTSSDVYFCRIFCSHRESMFASEEH